MLLVEDEAILAMGTASILGRRGYSVDHVFTGESALARMAEAPEGIDLILMDINLGRGDDRHRGRLEEILSRREIPIVFLSSHTEESIVESTEEISSYGYVVKNSGITVLDASIRMAFRLFEARMSVNAQTWPSRRPTSSCASRSRSSRRPTGGSPPPRRSSSRPSA